ncbi:GATOR complex protein MIOS-A [Patella vulgata]|uniref:GATOR complex protein MIOS-A n=1 Tax=Patella vulgata TaxID=6465 RepID=UPI00217F8A8F|nr:GATOR complex protein MIOS-A [Patella vulgata]
MASGKSEILWSPVDPTEFITYGSEITLYRVEDDIAQCHLEQHNKVRQISDSTYAVHVASNTDVALIKCVSWYPKTDKKNLLAVGQANGHVVLTSIGNTTSSSEFVGKEFAAKHARTSCNYVSWNPKDTHLLAEGLEKHRNDSCIAIWDINSSVMSESMWASSSRLSYSESSIINKPYQEIGYSESSSSFSWFYSSPKTFITGMNNRQLRIYDLRDGSKPVKLTSHKSVHGVCIDPKFEDRIASFGDAFISVWDLRNFDKPIVTLQQNKHVLKINWCPARNGMLSVLCKDSPVVSMYDIEHSVLGSDDIEPVIRERNIESKMQRQYVSSFAWHPTKENRLLTFVSPDTINEITVFDKMTMQWSALFKLTLASGQKVVEYNITNEEYLDDISFKMRRRIKKAYGEFTENVLENARTVSDEPELRGVWEWINSVRLKNSLENRNNVSEFQGVKGLLKMTDNTDYPLRSNCEICGWEDTDEQTLTVRVYDSEERSQALELCGWGRNDNLKARTNYMEYSFRSGNCAKAAAIALFSRRIKKALDFLSISQEDGSATLKTVAIAIAGVTDRSALWKKTCNELRHDLKHPYLRAIFAFLVDDNNDFTDILNDEEIEVKDRVAFACTYLTDDKVQKYFEDLSNKLKVIGDLNGLLLTGFTSEGVDLLGRYVDCSDDVQTAALISIYCCPNTLDKSELSKVSMWIDGYRALLDQWKFYNIRAKFDIIRNKFDLSVRPAPQVHVRCNFCGKSINNTSAMQMPRSRLPPGVSSHAIHKPKTCPNCRKSLPRCSVCLNNLGTASGMGNLQHRGLQSKLTPISDWFTWCQSCRHGGHAAHISTWFREHSECPVTACSCKCMIDSKND